LTPTTILQITDRLPSLEDQGIRQIYPSQPRPPVLSDTDGTQSEWTQDRAVILRKMAESLLLNFLELVGILAISPSEVGALNPGRDAKPLTTYTVLEEDR